MYRQAERSFVIVGRASVKIFLIERVVGMFFFHRRIISLALGDRDRFPSPFSFAGFLIFAEGVGYEISHLRASRGGRS